MPYADIEQEKYSLAEIEEGLAAMASLIRKCEKAQQTLKPGTSQYTTLSRRLNAFLLAQRILSEKQKELESSSS